MSKLGEKSEIMRQTSLFLPPELKEELEEIAEILGETQSDIIRNAILSNLPRLRGIAKKRRAKKDLQEGE